MGRVFFPRLIDDEINEVGENGRRGGLEGMREWW